MVNHPRASSSGDKETQAEDGLPVDYEECVACLGGIIGRGGFATMG